VTVVDVSLHLLKDSLRLTETFEVIHEIEREKAVNKKLDDEIGQDKAVNKKLDDDELAFYTRALLGFF